MLDFLEYEEKAGRFWHQLVGEVVSTPRFEEHAVSFDQVKGSLPIFFRALDVEKEAQAALAHGLDACGDAIGIWGFTSTKRKVRVAPIKTFDELLSGASLRRIGALKSGAYTRMGAAIRYVQQSLAEGCAERHRLLLLLSDGKPHDIDHYRPAGQRLRPLSVRPRRLRHGQPHQPAGPRLASDLPPISSLS